MASDSKSQAIREFLGEAEEIIEKLNLDLVTLADSAEQGDPDPENLNAIFRGAHSLKGLSGMFSFADVSELAHLMENLLDGLRLGKLPLTGDTIPVLFDALEGLTRLVHGKGESEDFTIDLGPLVGRLERVYSGEGQAVAATKGDPIGPEILAVLTEYEEHRLRENLKKGRTLFWVRASFALTSFDQDLAEITEILKGKGEVISTLPSAGDISDRITFKLLFGTELAEADLRRLLGSEDVELELVAGSASSTPAREPDPRAGTTAPLPAIETDGGEDEIEKAAGAGEAPEAATSLRSISRTVRVDIDKLDQLMNIVGELVLSKGAITTIGDRLKGQGRNDLALELQKATRTLERRLDDLQKGVMEVRMVPVSQLFEKMVRIVRRVSSETGKKVTLDMRGADTELDKMIIEDLSDPLMHIIRNAIDHGLELPEDRLAAGKPEKGTICLWAAQKGNHVVIEVSDDGRGIDPELVRRKALKRGLIGDGTELSRDDIFNLLFTPGFSTRDEVSDLSGRGVGMDVVKSNISALSGLVEMDSQMGRGTTLTITLPITLAIIKALIVQVAGKVYAIPINSVMETLMVDPETIRTIERREVMELRQSTLPLLRLAEVFSLPRPQEASARCFVAVVGLAEKKVGIVVDELLGQQDVVIKSLGNTLSFVRGIAGAADLGNQKTILVLDVGGLMSEALRGESAFYV